MPRGIYNRKIAPRKKTAREMKQDMLRAAGNILFPKPPTPATKTPAEKRRDTINRKKQSERMKLKWAERRMAKDKVNREKSLSGLINDLHDAAAANGGSIGEWTAVEPNAPRFTDGNPIDHTYIYRYTGNISGDSDNPTVTISAPQQVFEGGATRTPDPIRRELIPQSAITALGRRLALGATKHGRDNWRSGGPDFQQATINHLLSHLYDYMENGGSENVDAIITNAAFLCEFEARVAYVPLHKQAATK